MGVRGLARLLGLLTCLSCAAAAAADKKLVLSGFEAPGLTPVARSYLEKAYKELGMTVDVVLTEPSRALVNSTGGVTDGEVVRIGVVGDRYPTLVRVDVPLLSVATFGYTNRPEARHMSQQDLKSLRAGHVRGAVFGEIAARGFAEIWSADEPEQLFKMMQQGRLDLVFVRETRAKEMVRRFGLTDVYPVPSSRKDYPFFHYLHKRHSGLVPRVEKALRKVLSEEERTSDEGPS